MRVPHFLVLAFAFLPASIAPRPWPSSPFDTSTRPPVAAHHEIGPASPEHHSISSSSSPRGRPQRSSSPSLSRQASSSRSSSSPRAATRGDASPEARVVRQGNGNVAQRPPDPGVSDRRSRFRKASVSMKAGAGQAVKGLERSATLGVTGLIGTVREGKRAATAAKHGDVLKSAGHVACIPGRLVVGALATCGAAAAGALSIPSGAVGAATQVALLGKDAWKRKNEPQEAAVRTTRRLNNAHSSLSLKNKISKMSKSFDELVLTPAANVAMGQRIAEGNKPAFIRKTQGKIHREPPQQAHEGGATLERENFFARS